MNDEVKKTIVKYNYGFWAYLFILIILFWKDPDLIDAIIYWLTK